MCDDIDNLDDAIIEDTVHCCVCGAAWVIGGNDGILLDGADVHFTDYCNGCFCIECAALIHDAYRDAMEEAGD